MLINHQNWDDVKKYYGNTYVKCNETGETVWLVSEVSPNQVVLKSSSGEEVAINLMKDYNLDYIIPGKATYQYGNNAVQLSRIPARQWKKGICKQNTSFTSLTSDGSWIPLAFDISTIESFVNKPAYYDVDHAILELKQNRLGSVALTPRISISQSGKVFIDKVLVAKVSFVTKEIVMKKILKSILLPLFSSFKVKYL